MPSHLRLAPSPAVDVVTPPIRVVLADDHALMRRSLRLLLDDEQDLAVVAEAGDLASVERHIDCLRPHVLVLDLRMPDRSSVDLIGYLRRRAPRTQIVVLRMEQNPGFAQRALAAGASGFVVKYLADAELPEAVRTAARGEEYISPRVAAGLDARRAPLPVDASTAS
jgi:two-component system response regulator NreC